MAVPLLSSRRLRLRLTNYIRLRSNLCLWGAPPPYSGKGRPRIHGDKFKLNDQTTWTEAVESLEVDDPKLGRLRIRLWRNLHFRACAKCPMLLLQVERLQEKRSGKVLASNDSQEPAIPLSKKVQKKSKSDVKSQIELLNVFPLTRL